uniref:uncharacterized protein LOC120329576 isoform X2 n=1 Tax=Styela clava TaxID=7725 RepID=UPI00193ADCDE|nr:uncharacterized protein LOC120329576 isoform X2 [Styela clava]
MSKREGFGNDLWYTVQPKNKSTVSWDLLTETNNKAKQMKSIPDKMLARDIENILRKKIAYVSGSKDRRNCYILTVPPIKEPCTHTDKDYGITFKYLSGILNFLESKNGFTVILDARTSTWSSIKPVIRKLQFYLPDEISLMCIIKPQDFWEKRKASHSFKKYRDQLRFRALLISADKLPQYVEKTQLTAEFGGWMRYNHDHWLQKRISYEKFNKEAHDVIDLTDTLKSAINQNEYSGNDSTTSEYLSDSGHVSAGSPTTSTSTTVSQQQAYPIRPGNDASVQNGTKHVYERLSDVQRPCQNQQPTASSRSRSTTRTTRTTTNSYQSKESHPPSPPPRKARSRSLSPAKYKALRSQGSRQRPRYETPTQRIQPSTLPRSPPPSDYVYAIPSYGKSSRQVATLSDAHVSNKDVRVVQSQQSNSKSMRRDGRQSSGPRVLRHRHRSQDDVLSSPKIDIEPLDFSELRLKPAKSEPNLTPRGNDSSKSKARYNHVRGKSDIVDGYEVAISKIKEGLMELPDSTRKRGQKLMKELRSSSDEFGFKGDSAMSQTDEERKMMRQVDNLQNKLNHIRQEGPSSLAKVRQRNRRDDDLKRVRRKTVSGVPEHKGANLPSELSRSTIAISANKSATNNQQRLRGRSGSHGNLKQLDKPMSANEIENSLRDIYNWIVGAGENILQNQLDVGDSTEAVEKLLRSHSQLEKRANSIFTTMSTLKLQFDKLRRTMERHQSNYEQERKESIRIMMSELKYNLATVDETCKIFNGKIIRRKNLLERSLTFYRTRDEVSKCLCNLATVCTNEASLLDTTDGIHSLLDQLQQQMQETKRQQQKLFISARMFSDLMKREQDNPYISRRSAINVDYSREIRYVHWSVNKLRESIQQSEDTCEFHKNQFQHVLELKDSQHDASQTIEWMCEMSENIRHKHFALGVNAKETEILRLQHEEIKNTAKRAYDNGKKKLSCISVLRRTLDLSPGAPKSPSNSLKRTNSCSQLVGANGAVLPTLEKAWNQFMQVWEERNSRLAVAHLFHNNSEKIIKRASRLGSDLDLAFQSARTDPSSKTSNGQLGSPTMSRITPLREAHMSLNDEMSHVMKMGNSILKDVGGGKRSDPIASAIQSKMKHLDFLRSSLHNKWSKVERRRNVLSPGSTFMEGMKEATDWIRIKLVECGPNTFDIGKNLKEAIELREKHVLTLNAMQTKENQVSALLEQAKSYCDENAFDRPISSRNLYEAMAQSLADLWQELKSHLNRRQHLLGKSIGFYGAAEEFDKQLTYLEQYLKWKDLPGDKSSALSLLETHKDMRKNMLEASMQCLTHGQNLLEILKNWRKSQPDGQKASYGSACTAIECALESLIDRRRQVEHGYERRKEQLEKSLKTCHWESEVKEVIEWFEEAKKRDFNTNDLGENLERAEAMQCHVEEIKVQAQNRLERVKGLLLRAIESLGAIGTEPVAQKAHELDNAGESFMRLIDERRDNLAQSESFFRVASEAKKSLDEIQKNLDNMVFSTDLDELETQCSKFMEAISLSYKPAEDLARDILERAYEEEEDRIEPGAVGVENSIRQLDEQRSNLEKTVIKYRQEAMRINEMAALFFASCQELTDWMTRQACGMLGTNTTLGDTQDEATQFLDWHKSLANDIKKKNCDLESLVETANVLLEAGVARPTLVRDRAEELKVDMTRINKIVNSRANLAESFVDCLSNADQTSETMSRLRTVLAPSQHEKLNQMSDQERISLQEELQAVQEKCLNAIDTSQSLIGKLKEGIEDDNLETEESVSRVQDITKQLKQEKDDLLDLWLTWQYRNNVGKDVDVQWKNVENTADRLMKAMDNLEQAVFINDEVRLGDDVDSTQKLIVDLGDRLNLLQSINGEIEKVVKLSEILGLRTPPSRTPLASVNNTPRSIDRQDSTEDKDLLIRSLLTRHQNLQMRLKNYNMALATAKHVHRDTGQLWKLLHDTENDMREKELIAESEGALAHPKKESYVTLLLRNHDRLKLSVDELMKSITSGTFGVHQIINQLSLGRLHKSEDRPSIDKATMEISAANTSWQKLWQQHRETLLNQLNTAWYSQELRKQKQVLDEVSRVIQTLENGLLSCSSKSIAASLYEEYEKISLKIQTPYEDCLSFVANAEANMGKSNPRHMDVDDIKKTWSLTKQRLERIKQTILAYEQYYELALQCDDWQYEMGRIFSALKQYSSTNSTQSATPTLQRLDKDILSRISDQEDRISEMKRVFNDQIAHSSSLINTQRNKTKRHDFIRESLNSLREEALALKSKLEHQDEIRLQQEMYQQKQRLQWEQQELQSQKSLAENVSKRVQDSMKTQQSSRATTEHEVKALEDRNEKYSNEDADIPPPPPPPVPKHGPTSPVLLKPTPIKFTPKPYVASPSAGILKKSPSQHKLFDEGTGGSSTSGYSTLTDGTKLHEQTKPTTQPPRSIYSPPLYINTNFPRKAPNVLSPTKAEPQTHEGQLAPSVSTSPPVPTWSNLKSAKANVSSYQTTNTQMKPKQSLITKNASFEKAVHNQLRKYAGKPQESWESQIDKEFAAKEGKLFERPLAYTDSAESERSGATSQFTPVPESFTSVTAEDTVSESNVSTLTSMSDEYTLGDETTPSDVSTVESVQLSDQDIFHQKPKSRHHNILPTKKPDTHAGDVTNGFLPHGAKSNHEPPSPPPRRHGIISKRSPYQGIFSNGIHQSPAQRIKNKEINFYEKEHTNNTPVSTEIKFKKVLPPEPKAETKPRLLREHNIESRNNSYFDTNKPETKPTDKVHAHDQSIISRSPKDIQTASDLKSALLQRAQIKRESSEMNQPKNADERKGEGQDKPLEIPIPVQQRPDSVIGDEYYNDMRVKQVETIIFDKVKRVRTSKKKELPLRLNVDIRPPVEAFQSQTKLTVQKKPKSPPIEGVVYRNEHRPTEIFSSRRPLQRRASDSIMVTRPTQRSVNTQTLSRNFRSSLRIRSLTPQPGDVARSSDFHAPSPRPTFASIKVAKRSERQVKSVSPIPMQTVVIKRGQQSVSPTPYSTSLTVPTSPQYVAINRQMKSPTRAAATKTSGVLLLPTRSNSTNRSLSPSSSDNSSINYASRGVAKAPERLRKSQSPSPMYIATRSIRSPSPSSLRSTPTNENINFFLSDRYPPTKWEKRPVFHYSAPDHLRVPSAEIRSPSPASSITSGGTSELMGYAGFRSPPDSGTESWSSLPCPSLHSITSPSQCDTDCLIVADPTTGQIPDELSDAATDELVRADPYARGFQAASEYSRDGKRQMMFPPDVRRNIRVVHTAETSVTQPMHEAFFFQSSSTDTDETIDQDYFNTSKETVVLTKPVGPSTSYKQSLHQTTKTTTVDKHNIVVTNETIHTG